MNELSQSLQVIITFPFLVVTLVVVAVTAAIRKSIKALKPTWEGSGAYKAVLPWVSLILGIGLACLGRGIGQFDTSWGYTILLGLLAGFFSSWIWGVIRPMAKKWLKLI